jgi:hypothetical protein
MRRRITRRLLAAAAAGVTATTLGFTAAGAAGAASTSSVAKVSHITNHPSGGAPIYTPACSKLGNAAGGCSGYLASGRNFRFAQAVITLPYFPGSISSPLRYVALASPFDVAAAGLASCAVANGIVANSCPTNLGYTAFVATFHAGFVTFAHFIALPGVHAGDGVFFSVYLNQVGNELQFVVTLPDGTSYNLAHGAHGAVYTEAAALSDWEFSTPSSPLQPLFINRRVTQFFQGRFTTQSGQRGTFYGPWNLNPVEVTSNGFAPPAGTLIAEPSYLWTDGNSYNGLWGDAFGVWLYHL